MAEYYDYVLGLIPTALIGTTVLRSLVGPSLTAALPVGAVAAATVMAHALFVRNPVSAGAGRSTSTDGEGASGRSAVGTAD